MFTLTISTDNEAFSADPGAEIARILRFAADQVAGNGITALRDINGNTVGKWEYLEKMVEWECPRCHTINEQPVNEAGDMAWMACIDCHATL
jgi:hypothetical protein